MVHLMGGSVIERNQGESTTTREETEVRGVMHRAVVKIQGEGLCALNERDLQTIAR